MELSSYAGINYALGTTANVDNETGIHYGIISLNNLHKYAIDSFDACCGDPTCPKCGNDAKDYSFLTEEETELADSYEYAEHECNDYVCLECKYVFGSESAYSDKPIYWEYVSNEYHLHLDSDNDVWIFKSPYYTYAQYCSPCAPNAGHLGTPCTQESGAPQTYCLDASWFTDNNCPYPLYNVSEQLIMDLDA